MAYPPGFNYVYGPYRTQLYEVTSADTFAKRNPVVVTGAGTISQFSAVATSIAGIALSDSSQSISVGGRNLVPVLIPEEGTIFASKIQTGVAASSLTAMQAYNIELNTEHFRLDPDSTVTKIVQLVPRQSGSANADSADSSVWCRFLPNFLGEWSSGGTVIVP